MATFKHHLLICLWIVVVVVIGPHSNIVQGFFTRSLYPTADSVANQFLHLVDSEPLFLTPYIESNRLDEARKLSEVRNLGVNVTSYSGFFTVDEKYDSNMFFWFFPALSGKADTPILLWLQGGPGSSSLFGLFAEMGPLVIDRQGKPSIRNYSWTEDFAMIFIDNPVGTGYSFTRNDSGFARNEVEVAENLYTALEQFFTVFHEYQKNPFYLTGESYAGKYIPAIAYKIHKMGEQARSKMNLQGMAIGDGWCDPINMFDYGDYLYQVGLLDERQRAHFMQELRKVEHAVRHRQFGEAAKIFDSLILSEFDRESYFHNVTGFNAHYNILNDNSPEDQSYYNTFLASPTNRKSIHVGNLAYGNQSKLVEQHLMNDLMDSVKPWIEELLDADYRMLFYSGQLDIIVAVPLTENFLRNLHWKGEEKYLNAVRTIYRADPAANRTVSGYVRQANNLYYIMIRNAGHILPYDQPMVAQDMIRRFVRNEAYPEWPHKQ